MQDNFPCMQINYQPSLKKSNKMDEIKKRLKQFIAENGGNQAEIARKMGVDPSSLGSLMSKDDQRLSAKYIIAFAKAGFPVEWLLTGRLESSKRLDECEEELKAANRLIDSLERILKS